MGLRIGAQVGLLPISTQMKKTQVEMERSMAQLASGSRIPRASDDSASYAISEQLRSQSEGYKAAESNINNAMAMLHVAEGGLNEQNNLLIRMRELAIQSSSDTVTDVERSFLDQEFRELRSEVDRLASVTRYGKRSLLSGSGDHLSFQVGAQKGKDYQINFKLDKNTSGDSLNISGLEVGHIDDAQSAIADIDTALESVGSARAAFGAIQSRLEHSYNHASEQADNLDEAKSRIADVDVASALTRFTAAQVKSQMQIGVFAQANSSANAVLRLFPS